MLDETTEVNDTTISAEAAPVAAEAPEPPARPAKKAVAKKAAAKKPAAKKAPAKKAAAKKTTAKKAVPTEAAEAVAEAAVEVTADAEAPAKPVKKAAAKKAPAKKTAAKKAPAKKAAAKKTAAGPVDEALSTVADVAPTATDTAATAATAGDDATDAPKTAAKRTRKTAASATVLFQAPEPTPRARKKAAPKKDEPVTDEAAAEDDDMLAAEDLIAADQTLSVDEAEVGETAGTDAAVAEDAGETSEASEEGDEEGEGQQGPSSAARRRRRRGGRRRRKPGDGNGQGGAQAEGDDEEPGEQGEAAPTTDAEADSDQNGDEADGDQGGEGGASTRRRRRRVRAGEGSGETPDDPENTVTRVRQGRSAEDQITAVSGSTRLEAKKQRRREGREAGRRRAPIVSEAEFLARRESVERVMVIRQREDLTQIAVLEDKVLVEHYVARESQTSLIGNVYVGRVQNVLPSMEAAFIDIGKGRNAVLYAGEVNWSALGHREGQPRKIESVLSSGQSVLVQVTKDPVGHKGARLSSQISLAGRFLVYVPDGTTSGISRKLPDTERNRLKTLLKEIVPDTAGVIVRTAAEGASEDELTRDVERLKARWEEIEKQSKVGSAPKLLYGEPDLTLKVVRDLFTEDFARLVIQGDDAWETVQQYVENVAPDLAERLERFDASEGGDVFADHRITEQIAKGLDRKVWLPSGGSLIIDRTEAMTVVDVNTGKFTGSGGNLEETVTKNNLEAAEEIVRQLRLRDIGGIIVVDFIDMVLESNRDLVLRRLVECLGRDRTRHQVAEVTSLGLVQMTRKRIGTGLLEAFSENCEHCQGRGLTVHEMPVEPKRTEEGGERRNGNRRNRGRGGNGGGNGNEAKPVVPTPKDVAAVAHAPAEGADADVVASVEVLPEAQVAEVAEAPAVEVVETVVDEVPSAAVKAEVPSTPVKAEVAAAPVKAVADEPVVVEAVTEAPAAGPQVVTRTRRAVSRPAGSTAGAAPEPITIVVPEAPQQPVSAPEPPKVVTRTRRAVTRPAGAGAAVEPTAPAVVLAEESGADEEEQSHAELHVPIKKKGARKR